MMSCVATPAVLSIVLCLAVGGASAAEPVSETPWRKSASSELEILVMPSAWSVMRADQRREETINRRESEAFMAGVKRSHLLILRTERDRAVARAVAAAVALQPFSPPARPTAALADGSVEVRMPAAPGSVVDAPESSPGFVGRAIDRSLNATRQMASQAERLAGALERKAATQQSPRGYYALVLIALFLVPSLGLASILWGLAHLGHWSFYRGGAWIAVGAAMVWLAFSGAKMLVPPLSEGNQPSVSLPSP